MARQISFVQDFATKKAGENWTCDNQIASDLVSRGIAVYVEAEKTTETQSIATETAPDKPKKKKGK